MRKSTDTYKLANGELVEIDQMTQQPKGATLWRGFDYERQIWIFNGKEDTRTLEELQANK